MLKNTKRVNYSLNIIKHYCKHSNTYTKKEINGDQYRDRKTNED